MKRNTSRFFFYLLHFCPFFLFLPSHACVCICFFLSFFQTFCKYSDVMDMDVLCRAVLCIASKFCKNDYDEWRNEKRQHGKRNELIWSTVYATSRLDWTTSSIEKYEEKMNCAHTHTHTNINIALHRWGDVWNEKKYEPHTFRTIRLCIHIWCFPCPFLYFS